MTIYFDLISENDESTLVAQYDSNYMAGERSYMSERKLEDQFIYQLEQQQYEFVSITTEAELVGNLRKQIEKLNKVTFSDSEWKRFFTTNIAKPNSGIVEKTRIIQEDPRFTFTFDDGRMANIMLLDKTHIHENNLQVTRQYKAPLLSPQGERIEGGIFATNTLICRGNISKLGRFPRIIKHISLFLRPVQMKRISLSLNVNFRELNMNFRKFLPD